VFVAELRRGCRIGGFWRRRICEHSQSRSLTRLQIHAVHQVGMDVGADERLLPLFWALNGYKQRQEDFRRRQ